MSLHHLIWDIKFPPCYLERHGIMYNSDSMLVLPCISDNSIDMIVTDPPYGIEFGKRGHVPKSRRNIVNDTRHEALRLFVSFLFEAKRVLKPGGCCCCFCSGGGGSKPIFPTWINLMAEYLEYKNTIVCDIGYPGLGSHYRYGYDLVLIAKKPGAKPKWNGGHRTSNVIRINKIIGSKRYHPTPKPIELLVHFIKLHSDRNDVVLDPFAGSGTTLVAAKRMGRQFIGIEIESEYCEISASRLDCDVSKSV
jgi:DNA modification methylase